VYHLDPELHNVEFCEYLKARPRIKISLMIITFFLISTATHG
jgi:hypothetical protein